MSDKKHFLRKFLVFTVTKHEAIGSMFETKSFGGERLQNFQEQGNYRIHGEAGRNEPK